MTLEEFFAKVDEVKRNARPEDLKRKMKLYVDNARSVAEAQSGEWGDAVNLDVLYVSGDTLHVGGMVTPKITREQIWIWTFS
jgi:hypothetical protein